MEDFNLQYNNESFLKFTPKEQRAVLRLLPPEELVGPFTADQIRAYLNRLAAARRTHGYRHRAAFSLSAQYESRTSKRYISRAQNCPVSDRP